MMPSNLGALPMYPNTVSFGMARHLCPSHATGIFQVVGEVR
jgi:hypothetical protein